MPKITLGITGLRGISGREGGIEEPYWGPSLFWPTTDSTKYRKIVSNFLSI